MGTYCADQFDFYLGSRWVWGSVGVSWAALVLFTAAGVAAMTYSNPPSPRPTGAQTGGDAARCGRQATIKWLKLHTGLMPGRVAGAQLAPDG